MEVLEKLLKKFIRIDENEILNKAYRNKLVQKYIINLNTEMQLRKGLNSEGDVLGLYRSIGYSLEKDAMANRKASFGVVDLYYSGKFYKTFHIIPAQNGFEIVAQTDLYEEKDFEDIYVNVIGLTDENKEKLREYLLVFIKEILQKKIME